MAILLSAILFSIVHFRPYQFVSIFFLGTLLGYIYAWSGNLLFPFIGHFVNNGLILTLGFVKLTKPLESAVKEVSPTLIYLLLLLIFALLMLLLKGVQHQVNKKSQPAQ